MDDIDCGICSEWAGKGAEALRHFQDMQLAGVSPDSRTFSSIISVCADLAALDSRTGLWDT